MMSLKEVEFKKEIQKLDGQQMHELLCFMLSIQKETSPLDKAAIEKEPAKNSHAC